MDDVPVAADRKPAHIELHQSAARQLEQTRVPREHRKTEARLDRVLDGAVGAQLHGNLQFDTCLSRRLFQRPAAARRRLTHHEWFRGQVFESEASLLCQAMSGRRDDDQLVAEEWNDREVRVLERRTDYGEVELAAQDLLLHARA